MKLISLLFLFSLSLNSAERTYETLLKEIKEGKDSTIEFLQVAIHKKRCQDARQDLFDYQKTVRKLGNVDSVYAIAGGRNYLNLISTLKGEVDSEVAGWVVKDANRLHEFLSLISPDDNLSKVFKIITDLYIADEKERDKFFSMILAFAVVWDSERPLLHNYMGKKLPKYESDVLSRYNFLKKVYSRKSPMPYKYLNSRMLVYVVDLPLPMSELEWAINNEKGSASSWGQKFDDVKYDKPRFDRNAFSWGHGEYTFAALKKYGGICIDQAYYTAMTARCWGIPSMIFTGKGRRGGHAWLGLMRSPNRWTMNIGRYSRDNYSSGQCRNPQTNKRMNDHELSFVVSPVFVSDEYKNAVTCLELAKMYSEMKRDDVAVKLAYRSLRHISLYQAGWDFLYDFYTSREKHREAYELLRKQVTAFRKHDDYIVEISRKQVQSLLKLGRTRDAANLEKEIIRKVRSRDDLYAQETARMAEDAIAQGKKEDAAKVYEYFIRTKAREGYKIISVVEEYVEVMERTEQMKECAKFLKSMSSRVPADSRGWMEDFLIQAYEKSGQAKEAERLKARKKTSKKDIDLK